MFDEKPKIYILKEDIPDVAQKGDIFILQDGYFTNEDETVFIKSNSNSTKLFKHEKRD